MSSVLKTSLMEWYSAKLQKWTMRTKVVYEDISCACISATDKGYKYL